MDANSAALEQKLGALFEDPDFVIVHRRMSPFNLFEAVGSVRAELRHSNFLAYLLSPSRPHGLGTVPLAAILRSILMRVPTAERPIMALELIAGDLSDAVVYRERYNIDVLIELPSLNFVVAVENKVGSKAGDGQLARYDKLLKDLYPTSRRLMVFLTPDATAPDHEGYVAYDYSDLISTLESLITKPVEPVPAETELIIRHYIDLVRRHVVPDEKLRSLAVTLYERHKEAFDFIYECRPEPNSLLSVAGACLEHVPDLVIDSRGSTLIRFVPAIWDSELKVIRGDAAKWSRTGRGLLFEIKTFSNNPGRVNVSLTLGPGDAEMRSRVFQMATSNSAPFTGFSRTMGEQYATIFSRDLLTANQAKGTQFDAQENNVRLAWSDLQGSQLVPLTQAILDIDRTLAAERASEPTGAL